MVNFDLQGPTLWSHRLINIYLLILVVLLVVINDSRQIFFFKSTLLMTVVFLNICPFTSLRFLSHTTLRGRQYKANYFSTKIPEAEDEPRSTVVGPTPSSFGFHGLIFLFFLLLL